MLSYIGHLLVLLHPDPETVLREDFVQRLPRYFQQNLSILRGEDLLFAQQLGDERGEPLVGSGDSCLHVHLNQSSFESLDEHFQVTIFIQGTVHKIQQALVDGLGLEEFWGQFESISNELFVVLKVQKLWFFGPSGQLQSSILQYDNNLSAAFDHWNLFDYLNTFWLRFAPTLLASLGIC